MMEILMVVLLVPVIAIAAGWIRGRNDVDPDEDPYHYM